MTNHDLRAMLEREGKQAEHLNQRPNVIPTARPRPIVVRKPKTDQ